jgi:hypothetical protein
MLSNILSTIICQEFEKNPTFKTPGYLSSVDTAMRVDFRLAVNSAVEEGYRHLSLLIFGAGSNYIKVFARLRWTVIEIADLDGDDNIRKPYTEGETPWILLSDHDSCWRSDGVERVIAQYSDRLSTLEWMGSSNGWYTAMKLTEDEIKSLAKLWRNRTYEKLWDLEFQFSVADAASGKS